MGSPSHFPACSGIAFSCSCYIYNLFKAYFPYIEMEFFQYVTELPAKLSASYCSIFQKVNTIYFGMMNEIPKGSMESGMLQTHPFVVLGAWVAYKLNLEKVGDKMVNHVVKAAKDGMKKIDKGLEGKL